MSNPYEYMNYETDILEVDTFLLETPLYVPFGITWSNFRDVLRIEFFTGPFDAYCVECEKESVFSRPSRPSLPTASLDAGELAWPQSFEELLKYNRVSLPGTSGMRWGTLEDYAKHNRAIYLQLVCTRDAEHTLQFYLLVREARIMKIGQYPSLADLQDVAIKKYRKVLGDDTYRELSRAVKLAANGIGVGAFVYLRRIFEGLINAAYDTAKAQKSGWNEDEYTKGRMDEKILMLQDFLPKFLVEKRSIYSILSKGIHSLTEEECLRYFEHVKLGIELILDERIEQEERAKKIARVSKDLDSIKGDLG